MIPGCSTKQEVKFRKQEGNLQKQLRKVFLRYSPYYLSQNQNQSLSRVNAIQIKPKILYSCDTQLLKACPMNKIEAQWLYRRQLKLLRLAPVLYEVLKLELEKNGLSPLHATVQQVVDTEIAVESKSEGPNCMQNVCRTQGMFIILEIYGWKRVQGVEEVFQLVEEGKKFCRLK